MKCNKPGTKFQVIINIYLGSSALWKIFVSNIHLSECNMITKDHSIIRDRILAIYINYTQITQLIIISATFSWELWNLLKVNNNEIVII